MALLVSAVAAEGVLRLLPLPTVYMYQREVVQRLCSRPDRTLQYANREGWSGTFANWEFRTTVTINSLGLRDEETPEARTPGKRRILVLGDSFAFGWGVEAEETVGEVLESRLRDTEVVNGAASGWSTRQEVDFFLLRGARFRPDLVLLLFTENDPDGNALRYKWRNGKLLDEVAPEGTIAELKRQLVHRSAVLTLVAEARARMRPKPAPAADENETMWRSEVDALDELRDMCEQGGMKLAVVYVPSKNARLQPVHGFWFPWLQEYCARTGTPLVDLVPPLQAAAGREPLYFRLDDHWNRSGHRAAGEALYDYLSRSGRLPQEGPG